MTVIRASVITIGWVLPSNQIKIQKQLDTQNKEFIK